MIILVIFIPIFLLCSMLIYGLFISKYRETLSQAKKDRAKLVSELFPDLSLTDTKYRDANIGLYLRRYFYSPVQRISILISGLGLLASIIGLITQLYRLLTTQNVPQLTSLAFNFFLLFFFTFISQLLAPRFDKQNIFLKKYLKQNPSNDLRVIVYDEIYAKKLTKAKIQYVFFLLYVTIGFLLFTIYFWYFNI